MLIKCPECGKEVSSEANACPFCGYPIKKSIIANKEKYTEDDIRELIFEAQYYEKMRRWSLVTSLAMIIIGIIVCIIGGAFIYRLFGPVLIVLGIILVVLGIIIGAVGGSVNTTKYNNRISIICEYKDKHPDFKEDK